MTTQENKKPTTKPKTDDKISKKPISIKNVKGIIDDFRSDSIPSSKTLSNKYKVSTSSITKIRKELNDNNWKKVGDDTETPSGYFSPKNIIQKIGRIMFDIGFVKK